MDKVEPQHIRIYMDKRGLKSRVQANREHAFFSRCYRYGFERGLCKTNPCKGVRKFKEEARKRYITDIEYQALYDHASDVVKIAMELAYLCCARQGDILAMRTSQILEEGIFITQGKTGTEQIKLWSPRLRAAIELSKTLTKPGITSTFVLSQSYGGKWTRDGFNSRWSTDRSKARETTGLPLDFTFHDLKAKGISDIDGTLQEKQAISGHKSAGQTARYDRKTKRVSTEKNSKD
ncbi:tyrosine-type recombinase/integrase [Shewanella dokdonensis]|uniref:Tyrosine-type recombinase/integrase n=1 Tax=Shewanella dokdonensis TaxID=712036 RepID=A0ABX8DFX8_9GAMM|nr:tyrosine-type recombinase/integrase [Shewanella dokdonensis]QVK23136.1 tyrosine-type recombinase/integrase [Shewanella dokdonensis]